MQQDPGGRAPSLVLGMGWLMMHMARMTRVVSRHLPGK